jgi:hypothetical protein
MSEGISLAERKITSLDHTHDLSSISHHSATIVGAVRGIKRKRKDGVWELRVHIGTKPLSGAPSSPRWSAPSDIDASNSLAAVFCPSASSHVAVDLRNAITYKGTA